MDFGVVGLDGLVCSTTATTTNNFFSSENAAHGSGNFKQERPAGILNEAEYREFKLAKTVSSEAMLLPLMRSNGNNLSQGQQMLSFSSPNPQTVTLPYYQQASISFNRNTGYGTGGSTHGVFSGVRGPFTPSQWMELEHQALIYKYILANVPIPSFLLNPIRKAIESAGFSTIPGLRSNALGWGGFHLGFSNNSDPEPGRCRRTDGKKWRCSRDAVADQKYCERHINRGRHRSRKPVEGQSGRSVPVPGTNTTTTNNTMSMTTSNSHQLNILQSASKTPLSATQKSVHRSSLEMENVDEGYQGARNKNLKDNQYSVPKQQNPYAEQASCSEFGLVCSDSLLNPLSTTSSFVNTNLNDHESKLRQFIDEWPKNPSDVDMQSDRTQLSISIPVVTSDFISSTSSPTNEKLTTQIGLGVGTVVNSEDNHRQTNWIPISWEHSGGGPLGEVLHSSTINDRNNTTALSLMKDGWDSNSTSPRLASSPTGVLQKGAYVSLSNSSAGSSPRAESSKTHDGASLCNGLMNPSFPAM